MQTYIAVGHVCVDELFEQPARLGGTVFFSSAQAAAMGCDVSIVTACTIDVAAWARRELPDGIAFAVDQSEVDTRFEFGAEAEAGPQRLLSTAPVIDVLPEWGELPDILHLAPIFNEISAGFIAAARDAARFVGATPQGLLRGTDDDGSLLFVADHWPQVTDFADAIVLNDDEYAHLDEIGLLSGFGGLVFRTRGPDGASVLRQGVELARVDLAESPDVLPQRTIGAGDVFAAAAFVALARGDSPADALAVAVASATGYVRRGADTPTFIDSVPPA